MSSMSSSDLSSAQCLDTFYNKIYKLSSCSICMVKCLKLRDDHVSVTLRILRNLKNPFSFFMARLSGKDRYRYDFRNGISLFLWPISEPGIYDEIVIRRLYIPDEM